jgi:hypothetical protein
VHLATETIDSIKPSTFRSFSLDIACGSLAFSKDLSSINHARNDAIAAVAKLKSILKVTEFEQGMSATYSEMSEEQILHSASNIIRRDIESFATAAIASAIVRLELNTILDIP